jgi:CheY-specific phosphatase CheX
MSCFVVSFTTNRCQQTAMNDKQCSVTNYDEMAWYLIKEQSHMLTLNVKNKVKMSSTSTDFIIPK